MSKVKLFTENKFTFPYQIRVSKRAKRLNLKITPSKGVQVVIPPFTSKLQAVEFLQQNVSWVEQHAHIWQLAQREVVMPDNIHLPVLNNTWMVQYDIDASRKRARVLADKQQLIYIGPDNDKLKQQKLQQWVEKQAVSYLTERLQFISDYTQLPFAQVSFRKQNGRWGSCSEQKNISLNSKLIFLAAELIDYILIHELAHTMHMNHGKYFWQLVAKYCPDYKQQVKQLRSVEKLIPKWYIAP